MIEPSFRLLLNSVFCILVRAHTEVTDELGFRGKQIVTLTLVAGAVALVTSLMNAVSLTRFSVSESRSRLELLASTFYHQASRVIRSQTEGDLREALAADASLRAFTEAVVGYSPTILYLAITDTDGRFHRP